MMLRLVSRFTLSYMNSKDLEKTQVDRYFFTGIAHIFGFSGVCVGVGHWSGLLVIGVRGV